MLHRRPIDQARPLLLVASGGESSDAAALWQHAAKDRDAAVGSRIGRAQSEADFDDNAEGGGRSVGRMNWKNGISGCCVGARRETALSRRRWKDRGPKLAGPCSRRPPGLYRVANGDSKRKSRFISFMRSIPCLSFSLLFLIAAFARPALAQSDQASSPKTKTAVSKLSVSPTTLSYSVNLDKATTETKHFTSRTPARRRWTT